MPEAFDIIIVGGGHGGAQAAALLRQQKFEGSIAIVGEESDPPYDRPPLSKEYLLGTKPFERMCFRTEAAWAQLGVALLLGQRVVEVNPNQHTVTTEAGKRLGYKCLIWAAGGAPRGLPCHGGDATGVHMVRNRADVDRLLTELPASERVIVIGGGYIGLEAASALTKLGKHVTVLEALDRVLARVAGEPLSRFYETEHRSHDVDIRLGVAVEEIETRNDRVSGVRLADGGFVPAELVIVGIGILPSIAPLLDAGAEVGNGVRVDEYCRTSLTDIYAIGDCAEHQNRYAGGDWVRLESVQNANDQAMVAAQSICGNPHPYQAVPWFWSFQFDLHLQTVGLSRDFDDIVVRGDPANRKFSLVYLRKGRIIAVDAVNAIRDYVQARPLIIMKTIVKRAALADATVPLKSLVSCA